MLLPIQPNGGINREVTKYQNETGWADGDNIRFWTPNAPIQSPRTIGGSVDTSPGTTFNGTCRMLQVWQTLNGQVNVALGTHTQLYVWQGGTFFDITPLRTTSQPTGAISTAAVSNVVTITDAGSGGVNVGDLVNFPTPIVLPIGRSTLTLSGAFAITTVDGSSNSYTIEVDNAVPNPVSGAGGQITIQYYIPTGNVSGATDLGWGTGPYGAGTYGTPRQIAGVVLPVRTWSIDNFGQDLIGNPRSGGIYYWVAGNVTTRAIDLTSYIQSIVPSGTTLDANIPVLAECVMVSMPDRHIVAYGCDLNGGQDKMFVRWCNAADPSTWTASFDNDAGAMRLVGGQAILNAVSCGQSILVLTDTSAIVQVYEGAPYTYGFYRIGDNCGLISPKAVVTYNSTAYWMSTDNFYIYSGSVKPLPCTLRDPLLNDPIMGINFSQRSKIHAGVNREFTEIWWFYQSVTSTIDDCDRYISYNLLNNLWSKGTLARTAWNPGQDFANPIATDINGRMYYQEDGELDENGNPVNWFIVTGDMEVAGTKYVYVDRFIPDITGDATVDISLTFKKWTQSEGTVQGPFEINNTTEEVGCRSRGRLVNVKFEGSGKCQIGKCQIDVQADGKSD